jgi:hypothetical protein
MIKIFLKLLIIGFLITTASSMEAQDLRDKNGIKTGSVDDHGNIRDKSGIKTGSFDKENIIRDKNGIKLGKAKDMDKKKAAVLFFFSEL